MSEPKSEHPLADSCLLDELRKYDTPTICNALEVAAPERPRTTGFTKQHMIAIDPRLPPIVGYARTAKISAVSAVTPEEKRGMALEYYEYTAQGPGPTIVVVQDIDPQAGLGAHWGEVHTTLHQSLGAVGAITNGSFRDLDASAKGFQVLGGSVSPSHAYVHVTDYGCDVEIFGMPVEHGDLIHADQHGAVLIPIETVKRLPAAIDTIIRREKVILDAIKKPGFSIEALRKAVKDSAEIH